MRRTRKTKRNPALLEAKLKNFQGKIVARQLLIVIGHYFPNLIEELGAIPDHRKEFQYPVKEIYMACVSMFLFKQKSRNAYNQASRQGVFYENYHRLFGLEIPHMDTFYLT